MEFIKPYSTADELKKHSNKSTQHFDKEKITITKGGKTYNMYDSIQAAREDTEIYPTLEKYGTLATMERDPNLVYGEIDTALNLQDLYKQDQELHNIYDNLPLKEKNIFNNDYFLFKKNGLEYFKNKANDEIKKATEQRKIDEENAKKPIKVEITNDNK